MPGGRPAHQQVEQHRLGGSCVEGVDIQVPKEQHLIRRYSVKRCGAAAGLHPYASFIPISCLLRGGVRPCGDVRREHARNVTPSQSKMRFTACGKHGGRGKCLRGPSIEWPEADGRRIGRHGRWSRRYSRPGSWAGCCNCFCARHHTAGRVSDCSSRCRVEGIGCRSFARLTGQQVMLSQRC